MTGVEYEGSAGLGAGGRQPLAVGLNRKLIVLFLCCCCPYSLLVGQG